MKTNQIQIDNDKKNYLKEPNQEQELDFNDTGIEEEKEDISKPFDPTKIKMDARQITIDLVLTRIKFGEIELSPSFQRDSDIWNDTAKSRLIESLLIRIPLPAFYIDATNEDKWIVIDGLQRLTAIKNFVLGDNVKGQNNHIPDNAKNEQEFKKKFKLSNLEFLTQFNDHTYDELPRNYQRRINETEITVYVIEKGTPVNVKFNIFKRINTAGVPLSPQEIRHALNQGKVTKFLKILADSQEFKKATANAVKDKRMAAREVVLHFLAFKITSFTEYKAEEFDTFLNDAMKKMNNMSDQDLEDLKENFFKAMNIAVELFGDDAFRKRKNRSDNRTPVNKALFESWSVSLSTLNDEQIELLKKKREMLLDKFISLNSDPTFIDSISGGNAASRRVKYRFGKIQEIIQATISSELEQGYLK